MTSFGNIIRAFLWLTFVTGICYPLLITGISQLIMPKQANGSLIQIDGKTVGSELIGQKFSSDKYFWGRPSASDYNALPGKASNLGPTSAVLKKEIESRKKVLQQNFGKNDNIPPDLLFASGSGLDPEITPEAAKYQLARIAKARGVSENELEKLIEHNTTKRTFSILGNNRINVLKLNLALDETLEKK